MAEWLELHASFSNKVPSKAYKSHKSSFRSVSDYDAEVAEHTKYGTAKSTRP